MAYEVGQTLRIPIIVQDPSGAPADATAPANVVVTVYRDDETTYATPVAVKDVGAGLYHADVVIDATGIIRWTVTVNAPFAYATSGQAFVRAPGQRIVSLAEAKDALNKSQATRADDEEIRDWIDAATYVIEKQVGIVAPRTVTDVYCGGKSVIYLRNRPIVSVTSIAEVVSPGASVVLTAEPAGGPFTDNQYRIGPNRRSIVRRAGGFNRMFAPGIDNVTLVSVAGRRPTPPNFRTAALELIVHYWRASQLAGGGTRPAPGSDVLTFVGIAIPNRIAVLLTSKRAPRLGGH